VKRVEEARDRITEEEWEGWSGTGKGSLAREGGSIWIFVQGFPSS